MLVHFLLAIGAFWVVNAQNALKQGADTLFILLGAIMVLALKNGYDLTKFFFLLTFAAAIPAIVSGGIAERAKFWPQLIATAVIVGFVYPFFEGIVWNQHA